MIHQSQVRRARHVLSGGDPGVGPGHAGEITPLGSL